MPHPLATPPTQVLDDLALTNLDVVDTHGQPAGTLLHRIDHTVTAFGTTHPHPTHPHVDTPTHTHTPHVHTPHVHTHTHTQASVGFVSGRVLHYVILTPSVLGKRAWPT